jgi:hypothetical protein
LVRLTGAELVIRMIVEADLLPHRVLEDLAGAILPHA